MRMSLYGSNLEVFVQCLGEDDERATVVARDHTKDDRPLEVGDCPDQSRPRTEF